MGFGVFCEARSLELARSGAIWGDVWVDVGGVAVPEAGWNDMPVVFLAELLDAVAEVSRGEGRRRRVRFFDGPFWIDLTGTGDGRVTVSAHGHVAVTVDARDLGQSLAAACAELLHACRARGWEDHPDVRRLQGGAAG
ncbi:hypothetical protein LG634_36870 [Streptomyces bambusae]|uniref:hypothetical protein n=1 Tax=Streptomyces bambusae TaxID=1550616 RepID=UPI001CFF907B|nr:hypothetical protein [Streptomyces bambusae]MCB5170353.1 hypothetical protein [Streptomyces bambusae]